MMDEHGRKINYLRVSLTDRCMLRCQYCMPAEGMDWLPLGRMMSRAELLRLLRLATELGITRFRLTGGEPLARHDVVEITEGIHALPGVEDIALTTNGILFPRFGRDLKRAGVGRVNISLDTMRSERFREIARRDGLGKVLEAVDLALELGYEPVKLNTVAVRGVNDDEFVDFARLTLDRPLHVRFIELMPLGSEHPWAVGHFISALEIRERLAEAFDLEPVDDHLTSAAAAQQQGGQAGPRGAGPARYMQIPGARGTIGFITALSGCFCDSCNRLRLSADGKLNPCLGSLHERDLLGPLRAGASDQELLDIFADTIYHKPAEHHMLELTDDTVGRQMSAIGG